MRLKPLLFGLALELSLRRLLLPLPFGLRDELRRWGEIGSNRLGKPRPRVLDSLLLKLEIEVLDLSPDAVGRVGRHELDGGLLGHSSLDEFSGQLAGPSALVMGVRLLDGELGKGIRTAPFPFLWK